MRPPAPTVTFSTASATVEWLVAAASIVAKDPQVSGLEPAQAARAVSVASEQTKSCGWQRPADATQKSGNSSGVNHETTTNSTG